MKCKCEAIPRVAEGKPTEENGRVYWRQIFICENPTCENYKKQIGERKIDVLTQEVVEP